MRVKQGPAAAGAFGELLAELPPLLTMEQLCKLLSVTRRTVERKVASGEFPAPVRLSRRAIRFRKSAIAAYLGGLER